MNPLTLAQEIIDGRRITREDDLSFFLTCDLDELCEGADRIREACIGGKVDLCSIINGDGRVRKTVKYWCTVRTPPHFLRSLQFSSGGKRSLKPVR